MWYKKGNFCRYQLFLTTYCTPLFIPLIFSKQSFIMGKQQSAANFESLTMTNLVLIGIIIAQSLVYSHLMLAQNHNTVLETKENRSRNWESHIKRFDARINRCANETALNSNGVSIYLCWPCFFEQDV